MIRSFVYRAFLSCIISCIVRLFVCVFRIVHSFHFVRSCIEHSFLVSCVFRIVRVKRSFVSFAFFIHLCLVRIVKLYDPGSVPTLCEKEHQYFSQNVDCIENKFCMNKQVSSTSSGSKNQCFLCQCQPPQGFLLESEYKACF
jgi:hypothetical protein